MLLVKWGRGRPGSTCLQAMGLLPPRAQRPGGMPAGGLHFSCEKWRKEHQEGEFLPSGRPTLVWDILRGIPLFFVSCLRPCIQRGKGPPPPAGRAGRRVVVNRSIEAEGDFSLYKGGTTQKNPFEKYFPKESFQIRARAWAAIKPTTAPLRLPPQNRASEQRAVLKTGCMGRAVRGTVRFSPGEATLAGRSPAILSPCFLIKKAGPPPGRRAPGAPAPRGG